LGKGEHANDPHVNCIQTTNFKLSAEETVPITPHGELIEGGSFEVKVLPGALQLLI